MPVQAPAAGTIGGVAAALSARVMVPAKPVPGVLVTPVRPTFCAQMRLPGLLRPSLRLVACAVSVQGRSPARVSTTVMPSNAIVVLYWLRPVFSARSPRLSGLPAVNGVLSSRFPTGIVAAILAVAVHREPGCAQAPVSGDCRMNVCGTDCDESN